MLVFLATALLLLSQLSGLSSTGLESWIKISDASSTRVLFFDFDRDGYPDRLYIDRLVLLEPDIYREVDEIAFKTSSPSGDTCLYTYKPQEGVVTYHCGGVTKSIPVVANETPRVFSSGLVIGDIVIYGDRAYYTPVARSGILIRAGRELVVLSSLNNRLVVQYLNSGLQEEIAQLGFNLTTGVYDPESRKIYALGSFANSHVLLCYDIQSKIFNYTPLQIPMIRHAFSTSKSIYVYGVDSYLYRINPVNTSIQRLGRAHRVIYPADTVDSFIIVLDNNIAKYIERDTVLGSISITYPYPDDILAVDWWGDIVAVSTTSGVYLYSMKSISFSISKPESIYSGDTFRINVTGDYGRVYVLFNGTRYTGTRDLSLSLSLPAGSFNGTVYACRGVYCVKEVFSLLVKPRPLNLEISYPLVVEPYSNFTMVINAFDPTRNEYVKTTCVLEDLDARIRKTVQTNETLILPAMPHDNRAVFKLTCGDGSLYSKVDRYIAMNLSGNYLAVNLTRVSERTLSIIGYDIYTNETWRGDIRVIYDGVEVSGRGVVNVTIKNGSSTLRVILSRNGTILYQEEIKVYHYEIPVTITQTHTIVVTKPASDRSDISIPIIIATALLSGSIVYALLVLIPRRHQRP